MYTIKYIRQIKNPLKRAYAERYLEWVTSQSSKRDAPDKPDLLSYMAAQAVRMNIDRMMFNKIVKRDY